MAGEESWQIRRRTELKLYLYCLHGGGRAAYAEPHSREKKMSVFSSLRSLSLGESSRQSSGAHAGQVKTPNMYLEQLFDF